LVVVFTIVAIIMTTTTMAAGVTTIGTMVKEWVIPECRSRKVH